MKKRTDEDPVIGGVGEDDGGAEQSGGVGGVVCRGAGWCSDAGESATGAPGAGGGLSGARHAELLGF